MRVRAYVCVWLHGVSDLSFATTQIRQLKLTKDLLFLLCVCVCVRVCACAYVYMCMSVRAYVCVCVCVWLHGVSDLSIASRCIHVHQLKKLTKEVLLCVCACVRECVRV